MDIPKLKLFWEYPKYWAENEPDLPIILYRKKFISNKQLDEISDRLAQSFISMGLQKGDTLITILPTTPEFIYTFLAASKVGAITIPMDVNYKKADLKRLIPHSDPKIIVSINKIGKNRIVDMLKELSSDFGEIKYVTVGRSDFGEPFEELIKKEHNLIKELQEAKNAQSEDDSILIIWTGGTTGAPKAVLISHKNIVSMARLEYNKIKEAHETYGLIDRVTNLVNLPVSHVGGTQELIATSLVGCCKMIVQAEWSPFDSLSAIKKHNLAWIGGVPTMFKIYLSLPNLDSYEPKKFLKFVVVAGEKVSLDLLKDIEERICENIMVGYGATEAGAGTNFTEPGDDLKKLANGYVGKPLPGVDVIIADENGNPLPQGKEGEVLVLGPITSRGYYKMPEEDKAGFTKDGYCKTGDLGYIDENGGLYITGRIKHIIRVGSYTVLPAEIEELVLSHPKVAIAAALGAPDDIYGEVVWLVIGPELGQKITDEEKEKIQKMCEENLAKFKVPKKIIVYDLDPNNLPITRIGKIDRVRLKKELIPPS
ncbi:MAG: AMP-binding protein [Candidatus Lokiarchaeota archaeon]|nr:AMP-binding protein [Candidatus Lokiarchaeota archaeon]MBD3342470.1 AMP-binding protein [Candidatus Lokiarchaeota archaeon]